MKRIWALTWALACPLFLVAVMTGCSDSSDSPVDNPDPTTPTTSSEGISIESNLVDENGKTLALTWQTGDAFQLFSDSEEGYVFTLTKGAGKSAAQFGSTISMDAAVAAGMDKALYPATMATKGETPGYKNLVLPYYGQSQTGNATENKLTDYMYMVADVQAGDPVKVDFKHLGAQFKFVLTLPKDVKGNLTKLELILPPNENRFIDEYCPSNKELNKKSHRIALDLKNVTLGSDRKLTAYMMVAPFVVTNLDLTIGVTTDDPTQDYYYTELAATTKSYQAGLQYLFEEKLQGVSTKYATSSYTLTDGGKTLSKWKDFSMDAEALDMTKDVHLRHVTKIASGAFVHQKDEESYYYVGFKSIQLPDALTTMEDLSFVYLRKQNRAIPVAVGANLENISGRVAVGSLMTWTVCRENMYLHAMEDHLVESKDMRLIKLATPAMGNGAVTIPDGIRELGGYSLDSNGEITSLTLPMSVSAVDLAAMFWVHDLADLSIPQTEPTSIGVNEYSFNDDILKNTKLIVPTSCQAAYEAHAVWGLFENMAVQAELFTMEIPYEAREPYMATKQGNLYTVEYEACDLPIELSVAKNWTAKSSASWITLSEESGSTATGPSLNIAENTSDEWRYATVSVSAAGMATQVLTVQQQPVNHIMPVVVHILKDGSSNAQAVTTSLAHAMIDSLNKRYKKMVYYDNDGHLVKTFDTHIRLKLASVSPQGGATTGIVIHNVDNAVRGSDELLGFEEEMTAQDKADQEMLWPVNKYVNIFLTEFKEDDAAAGVSYLPFMRSDVNNQYLGYFWELRNGAYYYNLPCLQCLALDTKGLYRGEDTTTPTLTSDFINTAIHELGHYFGLHHTFDDGPAANGDDAVEDTPNYDRDLYNTHQEGIIEKYLAFRDGDRTVWKTQDEMYSSIREIYWRIPYGSASEYSMNGHGDDAFLGTNIMDYFYRAPDVAGFTPGQVERMRFGIAHSPTLPNNDIYTRSDVDTTFDPDFSIETKIMH